jgi:hypothetical protein
MTSTFRRLSASAERSTNRFRPAESVSLPAGRNFLQLQPFTVDAKNGRHPDLSTVAPQDERPDKISNINGPLRQRQEQDFRVNTGKDFCPAVVFTQLKTTGSQTEAEWLHHF